ncbi:MAG: hypothetical protein ACLQU1_38420, partial [Bryobacteraceae bacterium]
LENLEHPSATRQQAFRSRCGHCRVGRVDASAGELNYCLNRSSRETLPFRGCRFPSRTSESVHDYLVTARFPDVQEVEITHWSAFIRVDARACNCQKVPVRRNNHIGLAGTFTPRLSAPQMVFPDSLSFRNACSGRSAAVYGIDAHPVNAEVDLYRSDMACGLILAGTPDTAVREALRRRLPPAEVRFVIQRRSPPASGAFLSGAAGQLVRTRRIRQIMLTGLRQNNSESDTRRYNRVR